MAPVVILSGETSSLKYNLHPQKSEGIYRPPLKLELLIQKDLLAEGQFNNKLLKYYGSLSSEYQCEA